jgi:hypothetical protein
MESLQKILHDYQRSTEDEKHRIQPHNVHTILVRPIKKLSEDYEKFVDTGQLIETSLKSVNAYVEVDAFLNNVKGQMEEYEVTMNSTLETTNIVIGMLGKVFP